ncbi:DUF3152 domain-containing protein [Kineococcus sp. SYSU DK004]|uniref:DUF3152 domain-containing protein n=1 Tax=Kineococcus sp. SYSU DK004 TaxID=3383125 RepID=UPI003D7C98DE
MPTTTPARPAARAAAALAAGVLLLTGCSGSADPGADPAAEVPSASAPAAGTAPADEGAGDTAEASGEVAGEAPASSAPEPTPELPPGVTLADTAAGVLSREVPPAGSGELTTVPGSVPAPPSARVHTMRVEVERDLLDAGLVDGARFADFALATLNDPRGWGAGGALSFERTDGEAEFRLVLATPETSARLCAPLRTFGRLSCRNGDAAVLTDLRWVEGIPDYGEDRTGYRQYLVSHEVGHLLGHGHEPNPGPGRPAPVMMQQSKGLDGALPNPWPNP